MTTTEADQLLALGARRERESVDSAGPVRAPLDLNANHSLTAQRLQLDGASQRAHYAKISPFRPHISDALKAP